MSKKITRQKLKKQYLCQPFLHSVFTVARCRFLDFVMIYVESEWFAFCLGVVMLLEYRGIDCFCPQQNPSQQKSLLKQIKWLALKMSWNYR